MNALLEDIKAQCQKILDYLQDLPSLIKISAQQVVLTQLSELAKSLGLITAGELRVGNGKEPGQGFTGVRIAYPPMLYNGEYWYDVSVDNDVLQIGRNVSNGKFYAGQGVVVFDSDGINIYQGEESTHAIKFLDVITNEAAAYIIDYVDSGKNWLFIESLSTSKNSHSNVNISCVDDYNLSLGNNATYFSKLAMVDGVLQIEASNYVRILPHTWFSDVVDFVRFTNKAGASILSVDTLNKRIGINTATPQDKLHIEDGGILIGGDSAGYADTIGLTNVTSAPVGASYGVPVMSTTRPNTGYMKIMVGTTPAYVPYWTDIS